MAQIFKNMFVTSDAGYRIDPATISYSKRDSISYFLKGSKLTWKQAYRLGCRCRKYDIQFTLKQKS